MKILDLDMDYFLKCDVHIGSDLSVDRLSEEDYGDEVWSEKEVRRFLECNLGLSKDHKIRGRIVTGHDEVLSFWRHLIAQKRLAVPFDVIHVDTHADLGLGYPSWGHICKKMLRYPVEERSNYAEYEFNGEKRKEGIGDYLLYAIAYRMISSLTYCGNPYKQCNDYVVNTLKNFEEVSVDMAGSPVKNTIQLLYNSSGLFDHNGSREDKKWYISTSIREPEVPLLIIPKTEDVNFNGDFDYASMAQSPNYTPQSADFIMEIFREYIIEI